MRLEYVIFVLLLFFVIIVVGCIGNMFFFYIVFCWREMRILCNYFIVNNVIVDFGIVIIVVFLRIVDVY